MASPSQNRTFSPEEYRREGQATFAIQDTFYRPQSQIGRDLAVLAATIYRQQQGRLRVLDAMTGCGVRALRYQLEADADWIWANDSNPDIAETLDHNLRQGLRPGSYRLTYQDANQVFFDCYQRRDYYDLVDVDSFGSPAPYLSTSLWATRMGGLLYLTNTDCRTTSGHNPNHSLQVYGAYGRWHPAGHEQGLRLLLAGVAQQAATKGLGIEPVFSLFNGQVHRIMVRLLPQPTWNASHSGFLGYCHRCGQFQTISWQQLGHSPCRCSKDNPLYALTLSGPLWLGALHEPAMLAEMVTLAEQWGWARVTTLLKIMQAEASMPPYYYALRDIGRLGKLDIPRRDRLIQALQNQGYRACRTHLEAQAIKTDAPIAICLDVARHLANADDNQAG